MLANVLGVIGFEVSIVGLVESNQDGHDVTDGQGTSPLASRWHSQWGRNALQKSSTAQNNSSKLSIEGLLRCKFVFFSDISLLLFGDPRLIPNSR